MDKISYMIQNSKSNTNHHWYRSTRQGLRTCCQKPSLHGVASNLNIIVVDTHSCINSSVKEVPAHTKPEYPLIEWIVGGEEIVGLTVACIDVAHHDEETGMLEM